MEQLIMLVSSMKSQRPITVFDPNGEIHFGIVTGISLEDGSGKKFLIKLHNEDKPIFVKID